MSVPLSTHIFSARLEIVALMRDRVGLNGMCFRDSFSHILGVLKSIKQKVFVEIVTNFFAGCTISIIYWYIIENDKGDNFS